MDNIGAGYEDRITLDRSTGSLELRNLALNDGGEYQLTITPAGGIQITGDCQLKIYAKVQKPTINCPTANLTEDKTSANLTCNVNDTISDREWLKDGQQLVSGGRITFFEDNRVLSISSVDRTDNAEFVCIVTNPVSYEMAKCSLTVNYGPDKPTIIQEPATATYGEKATLTCSADSVPKATFTWTFNDKKTSGSVYDIPKVEDLGSYTCTAHNAVTGLEVSEVHALKGSAVPLSGATSFMMAAALTLLGLLLQ
ncbi:cell adhesion molecule CEACAM6-like [Polymixia lowei]